MSLVGKKVFVTSRLLEFGVIEAYVTNEDARDGLVCVDLSPVGLEPCWMTAKDWHLYESDARKACVAKLAQGRRMVVQTTLKLDGINQALRGGRLPRRSDLP